MRQIAHWLPVDQGQLLAGNSLSVPAAMIAIDWVAIDVWAARTTDAVAGQSFAGVLEQSRGSLVL